MTKNVNDADFMKSVIQPSNKLVLVDFWAEWCGPCKQLAPVLEEVSAELNGEAEIFKMDVDSNTETPVQYGVRSIPTLMLFKNGSVVSTKVGALSKNVLLQWIKEHI